MRELKLEHSLVDGRYEITERLSRGSYAEIFIARDHLVEGQAEGLEVVIKALNPSLQGTPDAELERTLVENFQNEAIALDTVRHPHVILRLGHGTAADLRGVAFHYLVLEYMPGGDLLKLCRQRPHNALSLDEALYYFRQVCEGLAYAHSKGIIHRDLKPNNFLLSEDHKIVKIADFGVAKITTGEDAEVTRVGADIYAPPEHHPEEKEQFDPLTAAADIYSLAKSFYTVVVGRPPSQFKCDPITALPDSLRGQPWGAALARVLRKATDDRPGERHASVIEFWSDLAQVAASAEADADEQTIVKPRLKVNPGALPETPAQPDFEPTLTNPRARSEVSSATLMPEPVAAEPAPRPHGKVVIELPHPQPAARPAVAPGVQQAQPVQKRAEQAAAKKPNGPAEQKPAVTAMADRFTESIRRRIFIALLIMAIIGSLASVYTYVRRMDAPLGFGPPTEIEVTTLSLNVRLGPSPRDAVLGVVPRGSRHRVLAHTDQQWMQIDVGQWDETVPHVYDQTRGWVYGHPDYVRIVSRRFW